jgi:peroxin-12
MFLANVFGTDNRPTFLELVSQEQLLLGLQPALQRVFGQLTDQVSRGGGRWLRLLLHHPDEVWLFLLVLLESRSLYASGATVAEQFYGLRRVSKLAEVSPLPKRLPSKQLWTSVLEAAILPYLRVKLDLLYRDLYLRSGSFSGNLASVFLKHLFLRLYPSLRSLDYFLVFLFRVMYLFQRSEYYSWPLRLQKIVIMRAPYMTGALANASSSTRLGRVLDYVFQTGKFTLIFGLYLLRFIDWYRVRAESEQRELLRAQPLPPPPAPLTPMQSQNIVPGGCGLCHKVECVDPSVCLVSGYVFCDACLREYIRLHGCCPLTKIAASTSDIRRLFFSGE